MSITYDPEKWSSPLRATDPDEAKKKSNAPVLVSIDETRYFKVRKKMDPDSRFERIITKGNLNDGSVVNNRSEEG